MKLRRPDELGRAVAQAVERGGVNVIECPLEGEFSNMPPPWL